MKIYISGQISGLPFDETKAKFENIESELIAQGYEVVNPIKNGIPYNAPWEVHIAMDILLLIGCEAIYLLPDWAYSKGATLEKKIAEFTGKEIIYQEVPTFIEIKEAIAEAMGISFVDMIGPDRKRIQVDARTIFAYYCKKKGASHQQIGDEIKRDHSTINYYLRQYKDLYSNNPEFRERVKAVENALSKI